MGLGTSLIFVAFVASIIYLIPMLNESHAASASFVFTTILYGITMFASSFVEEEHHFWYWTASAWAVILLIKEYIIIILPHIFSNSSPGDVPAQQASTLLSSYLSYVSPA